MFLLLAVLACTAIGWFLGNPLVGFVVGCVLAVFLALGAGVR